jgi:hypothetical protein
MKITHIGFDQLEGHQNREGFTPACRYGAIAVEENEVGGIFVGSWDSAECVERIFLIPPPRIRQKNIPRPG